MAERTKITITSRLAHEHSSDISVEGVTYHVQTEDMGTKTCKITTKIYRQGEVVFSRTSDYSHLVKLYDFRKRLSTLMDNHHKTTIQMFGKELASRRKSKSDYVEEIKLLLRKKNTRSALTSIRHAMELFPEDPFFISYYGCLIAVVENKTSEGIRLCNDALARLKKEMPLGGEFFYPVFYLNLGRAYLKAGDKKQAVEAFHDGLRSDPENRDLLWELRKLGLRRRPPIPFLQRSNPINKYIGMLLHKPAR